MDAAAKTGSETLWAAIAQLPPGIQVSYLILIAVVLAEAALIRYLLADIREARIEERAKDEVHRAMWQQVLVALAVLKERMGKGGA